MFCRVFGLLFSFRQYVQLCYLDVFKHTFSIIIDGKPIDTSSVSSIMSYLMPELQNNPTSDQELYVSKSEASLPNIDDASSESSSDQLWQFSEEDLQNMKPKLIKGLLQKAGLSDTGSKNRLISTYLRLYVLSILY